MLFLFFSVWLRINFSELWYLPKKNKHKTLNLLDKNLDYMSHEIFFKQVRTIKEVIKRMKINKKSELKQERKQGEKEKGSVPKDTDESFFKKKRVYFTFQRVSSRMLQNKILHSCWVSSPRVLIGKIWTSSHGLRVLLSWLYFWDDFWVFTDFSAYFLHFTKFPLYT